MKKIFLVGMCLVAMTWGGDTHGSRGSGDYSSVLIDTSKSVRPISPLIYGTNQPDWKRGKGLFTIIRLGGNRWTAYNWETNASNAGSDWHHQSDGYLGGGNVPGGAIKGKVAVAMKHKAGALVTVPILGYVSADKKGNGDVNKTPNYLPLRFHRSLPGKKKKYSLVPDLIDGKVIQSQFVYWMEKTFPKNRRGKSRPLFYSLDNEPDLWASTHARLQTKPLTYRELLKKSLKFARAIKRVAPKTLIFGPVSYGWQGFVNLQKAPDSGNKNFLNHYLQAMAKAHKQHGRRLLDVLDVHWYPEARGGKTRITGDHTSPAVVAARLQAPRSLWDKTYTETSWIARWSTRGPIRLLPRLQEEIARHYPKTKLAISEYYYGAGGHISGGLAQADALGAFGREGVYAAMLWQMGKSDQRFIYGAFALYRNYDGRGAKFGNTSVSARTDKNQRISVYASMDKGKSNRVVLVVINKSEKKQNISFKLKHRKLLRYGKPYWLTARSAKIKVGKKFKVYKNRFSLEMAGHSACAVELRR